MTLSVLAQQDGGGGNPVGTLLFFLVMGLLFYAFAVRPNRRRLQAMQKVQAALAPGREVMTSSGIYGRVVDAEPGESVTLEIAPGVVVKVARQAVVRLADEPEATGATPDAGEAESS